MPKRVLSLDDILGQKPVIDAIKKYKEQSNLPNVLLFTGPTGTGKTNVSMLTSLLFNDIDPNTVEDFKNLPYTEFCQAKVIGIKEFEDLTERMKPDVTTFINKKKKFFIIDEAHLLTTAALELALTGLEDLHKDIHVILCSTRPEKFIKDLRTRCTEFEFSPATSRNLAKMASNLGYEGDLDVLIDSSDGSYRAMAVYIERIESGLDPLSVFEDDEDGGFVTNPFNILKEILGGFQLSKSSVNLISKGNWFSFAIPFQTMLLNVVTHQQGGVVDKGYAKMFESGRSIVKDLVNFMCNIEDKSEVQKKMLFLMKFGK